MPRVLITGITGQDGGYLAEQLVADGANVHGAVRAGERLPEHLVALGDRVVLHEVDLLDDASLQRVLEDAQPDDVYNFAGVSSVAQSWAEPVLTTRVNGEVVARLLELLWAQQEGSGRRMRFLQASSAEIFAGTTQVPQAESTPLCPRTPYGASKAFGHQLVQVYRARGLHAVNAILYNHESPRRPTSFVTRKITSTVAAIADGRVSRLVLGNLNARRDWGWAPEYVQAMQLALGHDTPDDWIVATGRSHSVRDFVAAAFDHVGITDWEQYVQVDPALTRPTDAVDLVGNASKAGTHLGWTPETALSGLVGRMIDAERQ